MFHFGIMWLEWNDQRLRLLYEWNNDHLEIRQNHHHKQWSDDWDRGGYRYPDPAIPILHANNWGYYQKVIIFTYSSIEWNSMCIFTQEKSFWNCIICNSLDFGNACVHSAFNICRCYTDSKSFIMDRPRIINTFIVLMQPWNSIPLAILISKDQIITEGWFLKFSTFATLRSWLQLSFWLFIKSAHSVSVTSLTMPQS